MEPLWKTLSVLGAVFAVLVLCVAVLLLFGALGLPILLLLALGYSCVLQAFLQYRAGRQNELLFLLSGAAESGTPLAPALRAYLRDRPEEGWRAFWSALLLFFVLPGYYWVWHRRHSYDRKLERVARSLDQGAPLHEALRTEPGVASPATALAVAVGESTGRLALSLRRSAEGPVTASIVWVETLPRLLYPVALLFVLGAVGTFWMVYLLPRMEHIFHEFGVELPLLTQYVIAAGAFLRNGQVIVTLKVVVALVILALVMPGLRWYFPVVGRLYRMSVQSRLLQMLGVLLEAGKPLPEALAVLAASGAFRLPVMQRLDRARALVTQGEALPDALHRTGLLPVRMIPLVRTAERAHNLPWALGEMGNTLAARTTWLTRRLSLAVFSIAVVAVGVLVGLLVGGMFLPLVKLLTEMS
jgi:type II secretory pathway component PulF